MNTWSIVDGRLCRMERDQNRKKAYKHFVQYDEQRAAPSCPPDEYLHIRGGWLSTAYGEQVPTPDLTIHFGQDLTGVYGDNNWWAPAAFTTAGYYRAAIILRSNVFDTTANQLGVDANVIWRGSPPNTESSTAECAEEWADYDLRWTLDSFYGYPICIAIFKNDGITNAMDPGVRGHILPIDAVNRGRSYIWRDIRPVMYDPYRTTTIGTSPPAPTCT